MLNPIYSPASDRYENGMRYRRSGRSGVLLPEVSLGLWHNFGDVNPLSHSLAMAHYAFDHGITHFDLANNYGPSYGSAEETFGFIMKKSFKPYRDDVLCRPRPVTTCGPAPTGTGEAASRSWPVSTRASCVWGWIMWTCSIPSLRPRDTVGGNDAGVGGHRATRKSIIRGAFQISGRQGRRGLPLFGSARRALPVVSRALQPVRPRSGRGGHFGTGPGVRGWVYCFFTVGTRFAHVPLSARRARRFAHGTRAFLETRGTDRSGLGENQSLGSGGRRSGQTLAEMSLAWV